MQTTAIDHYRVLDLDSDTWLPDQFPTKTDAIDAAKTIRGWAGLYEVRELPRGVINMWAKRFIGAIDTKPR